MSLFVPQPRAKSPPMVCKAFLEVAWSDDKVTFNYCVWMRPVKPLSVVDVYLFSHIHCSHGNAWWKRR